MWERMGCMSRISDLRTQSRRRGQRGFSLVELIIATSLAAIVLAAILSAYLYVGRNLTRLVNTQEQETKSRRTIRQFTDDVSAAIKLTTASATSLVLTKPLASGNATVSYTYSSGNGTLTRTQSGASQTLLSGITAFNIEYFNEVGTTITSSAQSVKSVELSFTTAAGNSTTGTRATYASVSPRVVLRNKMPLE
jgi:prepilin-type N-terminal cleavage/methylation domain-containing protein